MDCKFTMLIRISKKNVPEKVMENIREGLLLRFNEDPICIDGDYKNKVIKEKPDLYTVNIRDKITLEFSEKLKTTPFDRFTIPFKVELTSKQSSG